MIWDIVLDILKTLTQIIGFLVIIIGGIHLLLRRSEKLYSFVKIKIYYPIVIRIDKRKHKKYIEDYLRIITSKKVKDITGFEYGIEIEWSNEENVTLDLERGILLIRTPYIEEVNKLLAKILLMASPYAVSKYMEPVFGEKLARILTYSIAREYASRDLGLLREFNRYVNEVYAEDQEFVSIKHYIEKAEETSYYRNIVLWELKRVLERFNGRIDKDKLKDEVYKLIEVVGSLDNIDKPLVCGDYISIAVIRAGKLIKVLTEQWERYIGFIRICMKDCRKLQHIFVISAGYKIAEKVAKDLEQYITKNLNVELIDRRKYRMTLYKGKTNVPGYIAIFETKVE